MEISFVGHACFRLRGREASVVVDPYGKGLGLTTLTPSKFTADILTISHDHPGHNNSAMVGGDPKIVDCPGEYEIRGVAIRGVAAYHDDERGAKLGKVVLFAIDVDDIVVAHLGDLAHPLTELQQEQLGTVDVLLVPAGGGTALSATQAAEVTNQLEPKIVVPMHYQLPGMKLSLDEPKHFAAEMGIDKIEYQPKLSLNSKPSSDEMKVVFLEARGATPT